MDCVFFFFFFFFTIVPRVMYTNYMYVFFKLFFVFFFLSFIFTFAISFPDGVFDDCYYKVGRCCVQLEFPNAYSAAQCSVAFVPISMTRWQWAEFVFSKCNFHVKYKRLLLTIRPTAATVARRIDRAVKKICILSFASNSWVQIDLQMAIRL